MATSIPKRGEVWLADLGMAAKVRPVLILSVPFSDEDYALHAVIPHTTSPRGSRFNVKIDVSKLRSGAFNVQGLLAVPAAKLIRKITALQPDQVQIVEATVRTWLGLKHI
jgi:mRNA interferase MazF